MLSLQGHYYDCDLGGACLQGPLGSLRAQGQHAGLPVEAPPALPPTGSTPSEMFLIPGPWQDASSSSSFSVCGGFSEKHLRAWKGRPAVPRPQMPPKGTCYKRYNALRENCKGGNRDDPQGGAFKLAVRDTPACREKGRRRAPRRRVRLPGSAESVRSARTLRCQVDPEGLGKAPPGCLKGLENTKEQWTTLSGRTLAVRDLERKEAWIPRSVRQRLREGTDRK